MNDEKTEAGDDDFAALFEASVRAQRFTNGQQVEGTIVAIGPEVAFVDVGAKGEATIALDELKDDNGDVRAAVGDRIQATVMSTTGGITLSRKLQRGAATAQQLEGAFRSGLPVEGKVEAQVKGGFTVSIARQRAFCPASQIDTARDTDPATHLGRVYTFKIIEYRDDGQKFVVSRRALLEEEQKARAAEMRQVIKPGAILTGRVVSVRNFGAFVDLGAGVQGLLHVSEMGWSRVGHASEVVTTGQEITVAVLRVDDASGQIALSLKPLLADPWVKVQAGYRVGQEHQGRITRIAEFGAFVELEPGIEGLAHVSTFPQGGQTGGWSRSLAVGMTVPIQIVSLDPEKRRIGVALVLEGSTAAEAADVRDYAEREEAAPAPAFGSMADKLRGALKPRP